MVFDWGYTFSLFLDPDLWKGAGVVVALAVLSWTIANVAGIGLALMRESRKRALNVIAGLYIWLFRSLPCWFFWSLPTTSRRCSLPRRSSWVRRSTQR